MPGVCFANELISCDEGLHCDFACHLHCNHLYHPATPLHIHKIVESAVNIEQEFVCDALPVHLLGMNSTLMCEVPNPFDWMETISLQGKMNFFEKRVGEYAKSGGVGSNENVTQRSTLTFDDDF